MGRLCVRVYRKAEKVKLEKWDYSRKTSWKKYDKQIKGKKIKVMYEKILF